MVLFNIVVVYLNWLVCTLYHYVRASGILCVYFMHSIVTLCIFRTGFANQVHVAGCQFKGSLAIRKSGQQSHNIITRARDVTDDAKLMSDHVSLTLGEQQ